MNENTYLILRLTHCDIDYFDPLRTFRRDAGSWSDGRPVGDYRIDAVELNDRELRDICRNRQVVGIARPVPVRLIAPVPATQPVHPPEPAEGAAWGVQVTGALQSPHSGRGVTVAVLDTGIDASHEAFRGIELVQKDFTGEGDGDSIGHGTHLAGTVFGQRAGGLRYSVAPGVRRALIGKVLGARSPATTRQVVEAIQWAVDSGAHVISLSLGFDFPGTVHWWTEQRGLPVDLATSRALAEYRDNLRFFDRLAGLLQARAAQFNGALLIAAVGNESRRDLAASHGIEATLPAAADGIVAVAALQSLGPPHQKLRVASFSNLRAAVAAPGVGIYSAQAGGGYASLDGTSMAAAHAVGVAALWAERQIQRNGLVNSVALDAHLRGNARRDRLPDASFLDAGDGLVTAPLD
jgi:subtilisin family serine protease